MMFAVADAIKLPFPDKSFDLVFGSPPYCDARTYGIGADRDCQEWIDWMLDVTKESLRVSRGAVLWVCASVTRDRTYWPACEGLVYEWWKRGGSAYRPCYWHRVGIPGSGGDEWFRADIEYVLCFKRDGKLSFSDNTAMGHTPKYAPGGELSHRMKDGTKRNQWGETVHPKKLGERNKNGERQLRVKPSHYIPIRVNRDNRQGEFEPRPDTDEIQQYRPPPIANPGNLITINVGGGHCGDPLSHQSEAPFPEKLAEWFIRSLCPPDGSVLDPFSGSGTTAKVARRFHRCGIGIDLRFSQAELGRRRSGMAQVELFA